MRKRCFSQLCDWTSAAPATYQDPPNAGGPTHFRTSGENSDLVYAVLLLIIGWGMNSPWRRAYQEQTRFSPSAPKWIKGSWVSANAVKPALMQKRAEATFARRCDHLHRMKLDMYSTCAPVFKPQGHHSHLLLGGNGWAAIASWETQRPSGTSSILVHRSLTNFDSQTIAAAKGNVSADWGQEV